MKVLIRSLALSGVMLAGPVLAEGPDAGCYVRDYSDAHLAGQPAQVVDWMQLWIYQDDNQNKLANMLVGFSNQGHVAGTEHAGQVLDQFLLCFDYDGRKGCAVECDGGNFYVARDTGEAMTIETDNLWVGETDSCGGAVDLAEVPGKPVKYKLNRVAAHQCEAARSVYDFKQNSTSEAEQSSSEDSK
ncbi:hypothetical protein [uncultured Shimia sp.]|uniref:hypothetical protein n=1 Tax=uncultured Shimia sp. TaxID=573152 RepID=UPI0025D302A3|nr:hypothetical protein [uncultured Shimia sp.]